MALYTGFFNSNPEAGLVRKYDAEDISRLFDGLIGDGVLETVGEKLIVKPNNGMVVSVGTGRAWFSHCWIRNDSKLDLTVPESDPLLPRKDTVVLEVNHNLNILDCSIKIITGAPAAVPVAATLEDTIYIKQVPLAYINVAADMQEVTTTDITNCVGTSKCPFVIGIASFMTIDDFVEKWGIEWTNWINAKETQYDTMFHTKSDQIDVWLLSREAGWTEFLSTKTAEWNAWLAEKNTILDGLKASVTELNSAFVTGKDCANINETMESGYYTVSLTTGGTKPNDFSGAGVLHVMNGAGTVTQILYDNAIEHIFFKRVSTDGETWSAWKESGSEGGGGGGTAGGSIITVTTTEKSLIGKNVTISNNRGSASASFNSDKVAVIEGFIGVGECRLATTDGTYTGEKTISIPYFGNFTESISLWKATVTITVQDAVDGHEIKVKNSAGTLLATITTDATGVAEYVANAAGTYTFESVIAGDINVVDCVVTDPTTYEISITSYVIYGFEYRSNVQNSADAISYNVSYHNKPVKNANYSPITANTDSTFANLEQWADAFFMPRIKMFADPGNHTISADMNKTKRIVHGDVVGVGLFPSSTPYVVVTNNKSDPSHYDQVINSFTEELYSVFPKIWIKVEPFDDNGDIKELATNARVFISDCKVDDSFHDWAFWDPSGTSHPNVMIGVTSLTMIGNINGSNYSGSKIRDSNRTSGPSWYSTTLTECRNEVEIKSSDSYTFGLETPYITSMLVILTLLVLKTPNVQSAVGLGNTAQGDMPEGYAFYTHRAAIDHGQSSVPRYTSPWTPKDLLFIAPSRTGNETPVLFGVEHLWGDRPLYWDKCKNHRGTERLEDSGSQTTVYQIRIEMPDGTVVDAPRNFDDGWVTHIGWSSLGITTFANTSSSSGSSSTYTGDAAIGGTYDDTVIAYGGGSGSNRMSGWGERAGLFAIGATATGGDEYTWDVWGRQRCIGWPTEDIYDE